MDSPSSQQLHFALFPFMAPDHMLPMLHMARLLSQRGATVTVFMTPQGAVRFSETLSTPGINSVQLSLPVAEAGLPEGWENLDMLASSDLALNLYEAANKVGDQVKELLERLSPRPSCIVSDVYLYYTGHIAKQLSIPRIDFYASSCFSLLSLRGNIEGVASDGSVEIKKAQLPIVTEGGWKKFTDKMVEAEGASYGVVLNTFEELESRFVEGLKGEKAGRVWCIGPVSLSHKDGDDKGGDDKGEGGDKASIDETEILRWLDSQEIGCVIYARLGSLCNLTKSQLIELGLGLEASKRPFIWVISRGEKGLEDWILVDGFEEKNKGNGLIIRDRVPQMLILSHPAVGGFLTHCGWGSMIEGISSGVPLISWPLSNDHFSNQELVVQIIKIGVGVGVEDPEMLRQEELAEVIVTKEDVRKAVDKLMGDAEEAKEIRERAKELGEIAKKAVEIKGSSHMNITLLIQQVIQMSLIKDH